MHKKIFYLRGGIRLLAGSSHLERGLLFGRTVVWLPIEIAEQLVRDQHIEVDHPLLTTLADAGLLSTKRPDRSNRNVAFLDALTREGSAAAESLAKTAFIIVGCGGLGSNLAIQLAALGAQRFVLVDSDRIEESNLNRLIWADDNDLGSNKAIALADYLQSRFGSTCMPLAQNARSDVAVIAGEATHDWPFRMVLAIDDPRSLRDLCGAVHRAGIAYLTLGYVGAVCVVGPSCEEPSDPCPYCHSRRITITGGASFIGPSAICNNTLCAAFAASQLTLSVLGQVSAVRRRVWQMDLSTGQVDWRDLHKDRQCLVCR